MIKTILGRTNLEVNKDGFGALPLQRATMEEAVRILQKALDGGINFYDTARAYSDSEEKISKAFSSRRNEFFLATKTGAKNADDFRKDLETSLVKLNMSYIDVYQFHNPPFVPKPGDENGLYDAALKAKKEGKIRFIGISSHKFKLAKEAAESDLFDTLQYPFSYLSTEEEIGLTKLCSEKNVGFIAMKALSGGLLTDIFIARAWMSRLANVVPIWGIQRESELDELLKAMEQESKITSDQEKRIERDRSELGGAFCRGCGYCLPCPVEIPINLAARMEHLMKRSPHARFITPEWQSNMRRIEDCQHCGHCTTNCPYGLDTPALLEKNYKWYREFVESNSA